MPYGGDVGTRLGETATAGRELAHRLNQSLSSKIQKDKNTKIQNTRTQRFDKVAGKAG